MKIIKETNLNLIAFCPAHTDEKTPNFYILKTDYKGHKKGWAFCFSCGHTAQYSPELVDKMSSKKTRVRKKQSIDWNILQKQFVQALNDKFGVELYLTNENYTIIDEKNYDWLSCQPWRIMEDTPTFYVRRCRTKKYPIEIQMHRLILGMNNTDGRKVDHKNNDGLDNRLSNIRICSVAQNAHNNTSCRDGKSKYKGVWINSGTGKKWKSGIRDIKINNGKQIHLGYFDNEVEAAKAYDKKAKELFGEFAHLNFPENREYRLKDLSIDLGISIKTLRQYGIGYNNAFTFPMYDEKNNIIGIQCRNKEGKKWCVENSSLGLFKPINMSYGDSKNIIICEGNTDAAVATECGFYGVGYPSASFGHQLVVDFLVRTAITNVTIVSDTGEIGEKSAQKISEFCEQKGIGNRIVSVKPYKDLREHYEKEGKEKTISLLSKKEVRPNLF